jgi:hypothetical protein
VVVVAVAGARAPSTTPFLAGGAAAAAAGAAGAAVQVARRRLPLSSAAHAVIVLGVAFITVFPAGAIKYTYGSTGSLAISLIVSPASADWGSAVTLTGEVSLYNDGSTVVRVRPIFEVRVQSPLGVPRPRVWEACTLPAAPAPTEADLVEVQPGSLLQWPFSIPIAWDDLSGAQVPCGAVLIADRGVHQVVGGFASRPFGALALVPVWSATLSSEAANLTIG